MWVKVPDTGLYTSSFLTFLGLGILDVSSLYDCNCNSSSPAAFFRREGMLAIYAVAYVQHTYGPSSAAYVSHTRTGTALRTACTGTSLYHTYGTSPAYSLLLVSSTAAARCLIRPLLLRHIASTAHIIHKLARQLTPLLMLMLMYISQR